MFAFENECENSAPKTSNCCRKTILDVLYVDDNVSETSFLVLQSVNPELVKLATVYCSCLTSLCLPGNTSIESVLNAVCQQTMHSASITKRKAMAGELENKRVLMEGRLRALKKECSAANSLVKQGPQCKRQFADRIFFYAKKFDEYRDEIKLLESHLYHMGFNGGLKNEALTLLKEENVRLVEELSICSKKVEEYNEFEANNVSLRKKVAELRNEIKEYDKYFNRDSL